LFDLVNIESLLGLLEGPTLSVLTVVEGVPVVFPIVDTSSLPSATPYTLTITGQLFDGVERGSYAGTVRILQVPEPTSIWLLGLGLAVLFGSRKWQVTVPESRTLALLGIGPAGLAFRRRKHARYLS
jgi:hypothetical protein